MKKVFASLFLLCLLSQNLFAQDKPVRQSAIGVSFLLNDFNTPQRIRTGSLTKVLRDKKWAKFSEMAPGLGLTYFKGLQKNIDFAGTLAGSFVNYPFPGRPAFASDALLLEADASVNLKMFSDDYWFTPYLNLGIGASKYRVYYGAFLPVGLGFKFNIFNEAAVFINGQYRIPVTAENSNYHLMYSIGISGVVGKKKQPKIIPPPPPPPPPADRDGDGILDNVDQCPDQFGYAKYQGCPIPDTDKDGINDEEDKCPTVAGFAKYQGCPVPDTDKDGINDEEDKCPTVAGVARYQGCPVPDTDNDGVNDEEDRCPTLAGTSENGGCPEVKKEIVARVTHAAKNIFFATNSARLLQTSNKALNEVARIMNEDPALKLDIDGHTDNTGKAGYNLSLSQNRANSVKTYLVRKGVDSTRLHATGYGRTKPKASNKTPKGRAMNRRVEMKLSY
jgi:OOP family OmpA-OmpF porin